MNWIRDNNVENNELSSCFGLLDHVIEQILILNHPIPGARRRIDAKLACYVILTPPISRYSALSLRPSGCIENSDPPGVSKTHPVILLTFRDFMALSITLNVTDD